MKIVADTMIWVSYCTVRDGYRHSLIESARRRRVRIFVSDYILDEMTETLVEDFGLTRRYASLARRAVLRIAKLVNIRTESPRFVPGDPDDDPIVQTTVAAKADYLVTADKEILKLRKVRGVEVLTPTQFEERMDSEL